MENRKIGARPNPSRHNGLGHVDGFYQDEAEGEGDDAGETLGGFLAAKGDAFEALQLPKVCSMRTRFLYRSLGKNVGLFLALERVGMMGQIERSREAERLDLAS